MDSKFIQLIRMIDGLTQRERRVIAEAIMEDWGAVPDGWTRSDGEDDFLPIPD